MNEWVGLVGALAGVALGNGLERWRDRSAWQRQRAIKWLDDRRTLYRDFLWKSDTFVRKSWVFIDSKDWPDDDPDARMEKFLQLTTVDGDELSQLEAEINLIGGDAERPAARRLHQAVRALWISDSTKPNWRKDTEREYEDATAAFEAAAREALIDPPVAQTGLKVFPWSRGHV
jgi:hypothetical protein